MRLKYLGTSASEGWPAVFCDCPACARARALGGKNLRTRAQALVDGTLLLDFPPESFQHELSHGFGLARIEHLFITHSHSDHCYVDDLQKRHPPFANEPLPTLHIYGDAKVGGRLEDYPERDEWAKYSTFHQLAPMDTVRAGPYAVTALRALHARDEDCLIYHIVKDGKALLYAHDTGIFPEDTWNFLKGKRLDLVSLDCTMQLRSDGDNHMGLPDNLAVKRRMLTEGMAGEDTVFVVSHFTHNGGQSHEAMAEAAAAHGILTAWDGFEVEV